MPELSMEQLQAELARERAEKVALQSQLNVAGQRLAGETAQRAVAEESAVDNAITAADSESDRIEREMTELQNEGKFQEAGRLARQLADKRAEAATLRGRKETFAADKQRQTQQNERQATDPYAHLSPAEQAWITRNPAFRTDAVFNRRVIAAANEAVARGLAPSSKEYFDLIEDRAYDRPERGAEEGDTEVNDRSQRADARDPADVTRGEAEKPQGRAAGPGSFAAAPTRRTLGTNTRTIPTEKMRPTDDQMEIAYSLAASLAPQLKTPDEIGAWYMQNKAVADRLNYGNRDGSK